MVFFFLVGRKLGLVGSGRENVHVLLEVIDVLRLLIELRPDCLESGRCVSTCGTFRIGLGLYILYSWVGWE